MQNGLDIGNQQIRLAQMAHLGRQSGVTVVETNHVKPLINQPLAKGIRPGRQLHAQPHDEKDGGMRRIALRFVDEGDVLLGGGGWQLNS